jgi:hypothetical protein
MGRMGETGNGNDSTAAPINTAASSAPNAELNASPRVPEHDVQPRRGHMESRIEVRRQGQLTIPPVGPATGLMARAGGASSRYKQRDSSCSSGVGIFLDSSSAAFWPTDPITTRACNSAALELLVTGTRILSQPAVLFREEFMRMAVLPDAVPQPILLGCAAWAAQRFSSISKNFDPGNRFCLMLTNNDH